MNIKKNNFNIYILYRFCIIEEEEEEACTMRYYTWDNFGYIVVG